MQSVDRNDEVKQLVPVDLANISDLTEKIKAAEKKGAVSHTIAELPKAGENVRLNGLLYKIEFADFVKGKFQIKMILKD